MFLSTALPTAVWAAILASEALRYGAFLLLVIVAAIRFRNEPIRTA